MPAKPSTASATRRAAAPSRRGKTQEALPLDFITDSLGYAIKRAQVRVYEAFFSMLGDEALSPARFTALTFIGTQKEINQADLAARLGITGPSVVKVIDALEAQGLVRREPVTGDRRRHALVLTPAGQSKLLAFERKVVAYERHLAGQLSDAERQQLLALLERVAPQPAPST